jgi:hypothetical protein
MCLSKSGAKECVALGKAGVGPGVQDRASEMTTWPSPLPFPFTLFSRWSDRDWCRGNSSIRQNKEENRLGE